MSGPLALTLVVSITVVLLLLPRSTLRQEEEAEDERGAAEDDEEEGDDGTTSGDETSETTSSSPPLDPAEDEDLRDSSGRRKGEKDLSSSSTLVMMSQDLATDWMYVWRLLIIVSNVLGAVTALSLLYVKWFSIRISRFGPNRSFLSFFLVSFILMIPAPHILSDLLSFMS